MNKNDANTLLVQLLDGDLPGMLSAAVKNGHARFEECSQKLEETLDRDTFARFYADLLSNCLHAAVVEGIAQESKYKASLCKRGAYSRALIESESFRIIPIRNGDTTAGYIKTEIKNNAAKGTQGMRCLLLDMQIDESMQLSSAELIVPDKSGKRLAALPIFPDYKNVSIHVA